MVFTTSLSTLQSDPNSMLAKMFIPGRFRDVNPDADGEVFIDRDGRHFGYARDSSPLLNKVSLSSLDQKQ